MRLLWMKSDYVIPADTGGKIRSYNLMRELSSLCEISYVCLQDPATPPEAVAAAGEISKHLVAIPHREENKRGLGFYGRVLAGMASPLPYIAQKYRDSRFDAPQREFIAAAGSEPSVILCDFLEMAENVGWDLSCAKVLFQHNVETDLWDGYHERELNPAKRLYFDFERRRMARYEARRCSDFDHVFAVTVEDEKTLRERMHVESPIDLLEAGVDTEFFRPASRDAVVPRRLLFLGSLDWMPNIDGLQWFLSESYPAIKQSVPEVSLDIVGRRPVPEIERAAAADPSIRLLADVPDVRPHVAACDLFVVPLRIGGGSRIKIYEAMAMGRPVLSTRLGAQGLRLEPGQHIEIADTAQDFSDSVGALIKDDSRRNRLADQGAAFVGRECGWSHVAKRLHDGCVAAVESYSARSGRGH